LSKRDEHGMNWLQHLLARVYPPISRAEALRIASRSLASEVKAVPLICHGTKPSNCCIYRVSSEPCWYIYAPWADHAAPMVLRSSRVILVGKQTGVIHYDGAAGDEG